jgi:hypothetical protein
MSYERAVGCGTSPHPAAYQSPREGVEFFHARRHPWIVPPSYVVAWRALLAPARRRKSSKTYAATITQAEPGITCGTGLPGIRPRHERSAASWPTCSSEAVTMSRSRNARGRPPGKSSRPTIAPASADQHPDQRASSAASVRVASGNRRYPLADASRYEPVNGRGRDALSIRCPFCKGIHLGRVRPGTEPGGPRRTPCGTVYVIIRRTYRPKTEAGSGAAA